MADNWMKRAVRIAIFGPLLLIAGLGMALMMPLVVLVDWATSGQPYNWRSTFENVGYVIGSFGQDIWTGFA